MSESRLDASAELNPVSEYLVPSGIATLIALFSLLFLAWVLADGRVSAPASVLIGVLASLPIGLGIVRYRSGPRSVLLEEGALILRYPQKERRIPFAELKRLHISAKSRDGALFFLADGSVEGFPAKAGQGSMFSERLVKNYLAWAASNLAEGRVKARIRKSGLMKGLEIVIA